MAKGSTLKATASGAGLVSPPLSPSASSSPWLESSYRVNRRLVGKRKSDDDRPHCLTSSPDGKSLYFLQGGWLQTIRVQGGEAIRLIQTTAERKFSLSPDEKQVLVSERLPDCPVKTIC